jgi:hypothetical protein
MGSAVAKDDGKYPVQSNKSQEQVNTKRCFAPRGPWKAKHPPLWTVAVEDEEEGEGPRGAGEWVWLEGVPHLTDGLIALLITDGWLRSSACPDECMGRCTIGKQGPIHHLLHLQFS